MGEKRGTGGPTSGGAGYFAASSRDRPHMGPTRKNSRHAQQLPLFLGHLPSSRLTVLAPLSGLSILTQPTSTAFIMPPIPVCVWGVSGLHQSQIGVGSRVVCVCDSSTTHLPTLTHRPVSETKEMPRPSLIAFNCARYWQ